MSPKDPVQRSAPPLAKELGAALEDLGLDATEVALPQEGISDERAVLITVAPGELPTEERLSSLCERAVSGLSFGYRATQARHGQRGRELLAVDLIEISLVTHPLQHGARVHLMR